jgi:hypothetical protein
MSESPEVREYASKIPFPPSMPIYVNRKRRLDSTLISSLLFWLDFPHRLYRWYAAFRSFRAHIRIQSPRMGSCFPLGPLELYQGGLGPNDGRILSRVEGIEKLRSKCPWVDSVDMRMWTMGFEEGEKYSMASADRHTSSIPVARQVKGEQFP